MAVELVYPPENIALVDDAVGNDQPCSFFNNPKSVAFPVLAISILSILLLKNLYLSYYKRKKFLNDKLLCLTVFYAPRFLPSVLEGS